MPEEDALLVRFAPRTLADDDLRELRVQRLLGEAPLLDMRAKRAELPDAALTPIVDDDFVHHVRQGELDRAHGPVRDDERAGLDPPRAKQRRGALEARRLAQDLRATHALLPALGHAHGLAEVGLEPARERVAALRSARMD